MKNIWPGYKLVVEMTLTNAATVRRSIEYPSPTTTWPWDVIAIGDWLMRDRRAMRRVRLGRAAINLDDNHGGGMDLAEHVPRVGFLPTRRRAATCIFTTLWVISAILNEASTVRLRTSCCTAPYER